MKEDHVKPGKEVDDDREPLLYPSLAGQVAVAADEARLHEQESGALVPERRWEGHLLQCCGQADSCCSTLGWLSCLYSRYLPCFAFGSNAKRGLRSSPWLHGILFLILFGTAYWVAASALAAASHNVLATCNGPLPGPHGPPHPHPHPHPVGPHDDERHHSPHHPPHPPPPFLDHILWGPDGVFGRFMPWLHPHPPHHPPHPEDDDNEEVIVEWGTFENSNKKQHDDDDEDHHEHHHEHESDGDDGDHHHGHGDKEGKHGHGDKDGKHKDQKHKAEKKAKKDKKDSKKGDRKILPGATLDLDLVKPEQPEAAAFDSVSTFEGRPDKQPRQLQGDEFPRGPRPEDFQATPECRQAVGLYLGAWAAVIASFLVAVHYAARRRTMLRTKFGIAGSRMRDFCTWMWCPSCALCQETRTLWINQVHDGEWNGPNKLGYATVPTLPPTAGPTTQFIERSTGSV